jgi:hypothetical protein
MAYGLLSLRDTVPSATKQIAAASSEDVPKV